MDPVQACERTVQAVNAQTQQPDENWPQNFYVNDKTVDLAIYLTLLLDLKELFLRANELRHPAIFHGLLETLLSDRYQAFREWYIPSHWG
jgi:hypothetical protein